jgi:hypothetical protein
MAIPNDTFKTISRDLNLPNSYVYDPVDNIHVSVYYLKSLYDNFNIYDIATVDRLKLMILAHEWGVVRLNSLLKHDTYKD